MLCIQGQNVRRPSRLWNIGTEIVTQEIHTLRINLAAVTMQGKEDVLGSFVRSHQCYRHTTFLCSLNQENTSSLPAACIISMEFRASYSSVCPPQYKTQCLPKQVGKCLLHQFSCSKLKRYLQIPESKRKNRKKDSYFYSCEIINVSQISH